MRFGTTLPLIGFALLAVPLALGLGRDPKALPSMLADRPLPQFELPPLVNGIKGLSTRELGEGRVVLVNVFASWCGGCRFEHPMLMRLAKDPRFDLFGLDWKDEYQHGQSFLERNGNPYRKIGMDSSGRTGIDLGVTGVPETFVIDRDGRVRYRHPGPMTPEVWNTLIEPVLKEIGESS